LPARPGAVEVEVETEKGILHQVRVKGRIAVEDKGIQRIDRLLQFIGRSPEVGLSWEGLAVGEELLVLGGAGVERSAWVVHAVGAVILLRGIACASEEEHGGLSECAPTEHPTGENGNKP